MKIERSTELFARAQKAIPGGVNSPVRAFRAVGGTPLFIARAQGPHIWDVDGNRYLDYVGSWGPMILGHAEPSVVEAVKKAVERGMSYGAPTEGEVRLAEMIQKRVPSIEKLRLVSSGTEATMSAIRAARGFTKRDAIVKFDGCYHGHADFLLSKAGSGLATFGLPDSAGVPVDFSKHTLTLPYNDLTALRELFGARGKEIACVIIEPVIGNSGCIPPEPGFLEGLRELTKHYGTVLIFDEVMTGFRVHMAGAQGLFGITPDLTTFGKIVGGGMPLGAYGGRSEIMDLIAPSGPIYQAGTLSGNPCAVAAGMATLAQLATSDVYRRLELSSKKLQDGLQAALDETHTNGVIQRVGSMFTLFFNDGSPVKSFADAKKCDHDKFKRYFHAMLERGIYLPPSGYEAAFVSVVHSDDDIERTVEAARAVLAAMAG
jgi:glutamate-1-semialdehyde 2,1-aminomutase